MLQLDRIGRQPVMILLREVLLRKTVGDTERLRLQQDRAARIGCLKRAAEVARQQKSPLVLAPLVIQATQDIGTYFFTHFEVLECLRWIITLPHVAASPVAIDKLEEETVMGR